MSEHNNKPLRTYKINHTGKFSLRAIIYTLSLIVLIIVLLGFGFFASYQKADTGSASADRTAAKEASASAKPVNLGDALRQSTVDYVFEKDSIPNYSYDQICSMDVSKPSGVTVSDLKLVTKGNLVGLEEAFWKTEQDYDINCLFVLAIASHESAYGTHCFRPNNLFGFGRSGYPSKAACIDTVAKCLANKYLNPSGSLYKGKTIDSVNKRYAADPAWDKKVAKKMAGFYSVINSAHNSQLEKLR